jgi:MoaA/NifB/PqqE/SkfB family radical SAM enzyme
MRKTDSLDLLCWAKRFHRIRLLTNGTLIDQETAERLVDMQAGIRISIDGGTSERHDVMRGPGSFQKTLNGIANLIHAGYDPQSIEIYATIDPTSPDYVDEIISFADMQGIRTIKLEGVAKQGRALLHWPGTMPNGQYEDNKNYIDIVQSLQENPSYANWKFSDLLPVELAFETFTVYSDGRAFAYTYTGDEDELNGYLGSILEEDLKHLVDEQRLSKAIVGKLLMFGRAPRSLQAFWAEKRPSNGSRMSA